MNTKVSVDWLLWYIGTQQSDEAYAANPILLNLSERKAAIEYLRGLRAKRIYWVE